LTTARTPAHQQRQRCHHHDGNNRDCDDGKDACTLMVTVQSQQGQQRQLDNKQQGQQR
jgi:hypothetical protein